MGFWQWSWYPCHGKSFAFTAYPTKKDSGNISINSPYGTQLLAISSFLQDLLFKFQKLRCKVCLLIHFHCFFCTDVGFDWRIVMELGMVTTKEFPPMYNVVSVQRLSMTLGMVPLKAFFSTVRKIRVWESWPMEGGRVPVIRLSNKSSSSNLVQLESAPNIEVF